MFDPSDFIDEAIENMKNKIGNKKAIIALSGGVDSSVASVLTHKAIGDNLIAVFVDHGLLREGESTYVEETFEKRLNFMCVDAKDEFLGELEGVEDPEEKRKIIGKVFIRVFERIAKKEGAEFLVQGTIAPDWIESHEVRIVGRELGIPDDIVKRQPYPGPGLAVRIVGALTPEKIEICRKANAIVEEEVKKEGLNETLWQYFAVLTDTKVTGVKGDIRDFGYLVVLRMVESMDAMTAEVPELPWSMIKIISQRITAQIPEVTHVALSVSDKPPSTIEFA